MLVGRPVGDVAKEDPLGREEADRIGQPDQIQLARRELIRIEQDARQLERCRAGGCRCRYTGSVCSSPESQNDMPPERSSSRFTSDERRPEFAWTWREVQKFALPAPAPHTPASTM